MPEAPARGRQSRPPAYCSAETLARELDLRSPETIHEMARRGDLPKPVRIGTNKRWRWADVEARLRGPEDAPRTEPGDPLLEALNGEAGPS